MRPTSARAQSARTLLQLGRPPSSSSSPEVGARAGVLTQDPPRREQLPREPSIPMARFRGVSCCATTDVRGRPPLHGRLLLHSPPEAVSGTKWVWYGKHGTGRAALPIGCSQRRDYADEVGGHACSHFFGRIAVVVAASAAQLVWSEPGTTGAAVGASGWGHRRGWDALAMAVAPARLSLGVSVPLLPQFSRGTSRHTSSGLLARLVLGRQLAVDDAMGGDSTSTTKRLEKPAASSSPSSRDPSPDG
ncbi:hypothetical protein PCL_00303 [Purpureocillium lilacinum]|uniref:Uncharacterized protein n=1 Tax=Purpureocillium lilacinum TaxID=33203 RepID=A0A2U3E6R1_PURLI|nr:hypothetical protein PCL_00303 [Purpureocillium lilacinum]